MNIGSHLCLASYLLKSCLYPLKTIEKFAFLFGNIYPDISCSYFIKRHTPLMRYSSVIAKIEKHLKRIDSLKNPTYFQTGIIAHYLADFFTAPHNTETKLYSRGHYLYEQMLKQEIYKIKSDNSYIVHTVTEEIDMIEYIKVLRCEYVNTPSNIKTDAYYILNICSIYFDVINKKIQMSIPIKAPLYEFSILPN